MVQYLMFLVSSKDGDSTCLKFPMCYSWDFFVEKQKDKEHNMKWHELLIMPFPKTCKNLLQTVVLFLPLHKNNADVAFEGGNEEMLADFVRQHAVIRELEMARKNSHDWAVFRTDKIKKFLRVGVGLVETVFAPRQVAPLGVLAHAHFRVVLVHQRVKRNMGIDDDGLAFRIDFLETLEARFGHVARGVVETDNRQIVEFQHLDGFVAVDGFLQFIDFLCVASREPPGGDIMIGASVHIGNGEFVHAFFQDADTGQRAEIADIAAEKNGVRSRFIENFRHHLPIFEGCLAIVRIAERLVNA